MFVRKFIQAVQKPTAKNWGDVVKATVPNPVQTIKDVKRVVEKPTLANFMRAASSPPLVADAVQITKNMAEHTVSNIKEAIENPSLETFLKADPMSQVPGHIGPIQAVTDTVEIIAAVEQGAGAVLEKAGQIAIRSAMQASGIPASVIVEANLSSLQSQVKEWKSIPQILINLIQEYYQTNLAGVKYAENIDTYMGGNTAIAFPGQIFFPRSIDPLHNQDDLHWLLHELTHQDQYNRVGGLKNYVENYTADSILKIIEKGTFSPHDHLNYEKEADAVADALVAYVWSELNPELMSTMAP